MGECVYIVGVGISVYSYYVWDGKSARMCRIVFDLH